MSSNQLRIIHRPTKKIIADGQIGTSLIEFREFLYTDKISEEFKLERTGKVASFFTGLGQKYRLMWQDKVILSEVIKSSIPNPLFLFTKDKLGIPKAHRDILLEPYSDSDALSYVDDEIYDNNQRVEKVLQELTLIDKRTDESSYLYKDKKTERVWQLSYDNPNQKDNTPMRLTNVTYPQWTFEYVEQRELKRRGENPVDPEEFMDMMRDDPRGGQCANEGCNRAKAKFTPLCKYCHFEIIFGRPYES